MRCFHYYMTLLRFHLLEDDNKSPFQPTSCAHPHHPTPTLPIIPDFVNQKIVNIAGDLRKTYCEVTQLASAKRPAKGAKHPVKGRPIPHRLQAIPPNGSFVTQIDPNMTAFRRIMTRL